MKKFARIVTILINAALFLYLFLTFLSHTFTETAGAYLPAISESSRLEAGKRLKLLPRTEALAMRSGGTFQNFDLPNIATPYLAFVYPPTSLLPQIVDGGPVGSGKFMRLAFAGPANSHNGLAFMRSDSGTFDQIVADFDFRITPGSGRADGLGFALLNTADYGITGTAGPLNVAEEPNFLNSLGIGFDIYQSPGEVSDNHLSLHFNNAQVAEIDIDPNDVDLAGGQWIHARIVMRPGGGHSDVSVILTQYGGTAVTIADQIPVSGFTPYEGRAYFGARAGGLWADHDIDNVHVQFLDLSQSVLAFANGAYTVEEESATAALTVIRSGLASGAVSIDYATTDGTASAGSDYEATAGTLTFAAGETTKTINVPILTDGQQEGAENFLVTLANAAGGDVIGEPATALVTILADPQGTYQDFDLPGSGTAYLTATVPTTNMPPSLLDGGKTEIGRFLRMAFGEPTANHNVLNFEGTGVGNSDYVVADFDFRITPGTGRADGFGFALLNIANYALTGTVLPLAVAEEPNFANSLGIGFDIYQSGDMTNGYELNYNHISIHYDGVLITEVNAFPALDLAASQWVHAQVVVRPDPPYRDVSVVLTQCGRPPVTAVDRFPIPNLVPYESRVHFAARAGGLTADFDLDNVHVQSLSEGQSSLNFSTSCYSVVETEGEVVLTVGRSGSLNGTVTVDYQTVAHTASASDFTPTSGTLTFNSGQATNSISVALTDDALDEGDESFLLSLSNPGGNTALAGPAMAKVTIIDDERARQEGYWSDVIPSEVIPIHAMLLPTGQVMYWDRHGAVEGWDPTPRIWDPITEIIAPAAVAGHELFCSGHTFLEDGRLLVAGGHIEDIVGDNAASIYDPFTNTWENLPNMNNGRWYPSNVTLPNGNVLVLGGTYALPNVLNTVPQILQITNTQWISLSAHGVYPDYADYYPYLFVTPNGDVFNAGPQQMARYLDVQTGIWTDVDASTVPYRDYGSSVMYDEGMVMIVGGNPRDPDPDNPTILPGASTEIINLNDATPMWTPVMAMNFGRRHHNATLLPDGKVLVTGGSSAPGFDNRDGAVLAAEMWDPESEMWTIMAEQTLYRGYHSVALLLPDGRVLVGGGGHPDPDGVPQYNFEIYSPPYLFHESRPEIVSAPASVRYGETFFVATPDAAEIATINLVRLSAVTHAYNQDQRINKGLDFTVTPGGLNITAPGDDRLATPGYYMLFILDAEGIPSVAQIMQLTHGAGPMIEVTKEASHSPVIVGTAVTYTYRITNSGNVVLNSLTASDDKLGTISLPVTTLFPNASTIATVTYVVSKTDLPGPLTNTVTVTGTPLIGPAVTATATETVIIIRWAVYLPFLLKD